MSSNRITQVKRPTQIPGFVSSISAAKKVDLQIWARKNGISHVWWSRERKMAYFPNNEAIRIRSGFICTACNMASISEVCCLCNGKCEEIQ